MSAVTEAGRGVPLSGHRALLAAIGLALLSALPFFVAARPQQTDFPSHLARYHVMLEGEGNAVLSRYYDFTWAWSGNVGVDLLMWPLGRMLGAETAAWLISMLLPPMIGCGILAVEWTLRRRIGVGSLLALITVWSPAMIMGFANFSLSLAAALFAFALWVRLEKWRWRAPLFIVAGFLVWLCHSAGWGVLGVLVFGYEWHLRRNLSAFLAPWPLFFPLVAILAEPGIGGSLQYGKNVAGYKFAIWAKALADRMPMLDLLTLAVLVVAIAGAARRGKLDGRLAWSALAIALLTLAMPRHFGGGDFADRRLIPVALMVGCLAIDMQVRRGVLCLAAALFLARLGITTAAWKHDSDRLEVALAALDHIPRGSRIAAASSLDAQLWGADAFDHAASYATVYRDALVNTHFAVPGVHMLRVKGQGAEFADPSQRVTPRPDGTMDLSNHPPAKGAGYLWYFGAEPVSRLPPGASVIYRSDGSLLARLANPPPSR